MKKKRKVKPLTDDNSKYVEQVHDETFNHVDRYCSHLTHDADEGQDLRQEAYTRFSSHVAYEGPLEGDQPPKPYLFNIAKNTLRNQIRDNRLQIDSSIDEEQHPDDTPGRDSNASNSKTEYWNTQAAAARQSTYFDRFKLLMPIIESRLSSDEWRLLWHHWAESMSYEEISAIIGQPHDQVAYRANKAIAKARYWAKQLTKRQ